MAERTEIEWCDSTFNPWIGCTKVSLGCDHCYAERLDARGIFGGQHWGPGAPRKRTSATNWRKPLAWNAQPFCECPDCGWRGERREAMTVVGLLNIAEDWCPNCSKAVVTEARRRVFCASLADVFDNEVPTAWRLDLFSLIAQTPHLDWLILTKRIGNVRAMCTDDGLMFDMLHDRVWLGITVTSQPEADRDIPKLLAAPARVRFLSIEPMLGPVDLTPAYLPCPNAENVIMDPETGGYECCSHCDYTGVSDELGIDWVIVGGESGPKARPMHPQWVRDLRDQCRAADLPFMFKQHGEWLATDFCDDDMAMIPAERTVYVRPDGSFHDGTAGVDFFGGEEETAWIGKKNAGRLLDGVEHNEFPRVPA